MRFDTDQLVLKALCVLDEAVEQCRDAPLPSSFGLRFALAYLHNVSRADRHWFDTFWKHVRYPRSYPSAGMAGFNRQIVAQAAMGAIVAGLDRPPSQEAIRLARRGREERVRAYTSDLVRQHQREKQEKREKRRR